MLPSTKIFHSSTAYWPHTLVSTLQKTAATQNQSVFVRAVTEFTAGNELPSWQLFPNLYMYMDNVKA